jgi:thiamine-phosphate pyrophosphorylase
MGQSQPRARICLTLDAGPGAVDQLAAALGAVDAASVVIRPGARATALSASEAQPLVDLAQSRGAAALIEADARLARVVAADGVHLPWSADIIERYREARSILGRRAIVGAEAGRSRHDSMLLGEAGADYVAFRRLAQGSGESAEADGAVAGPQDQLDLVAWWAEIFEVPVVACDVGTEDEAAAALEAGADFLGHEAEPGVPAAGLVENLRRIGALVAAAAR